ncbi:DUF2255 family protein [Nakamurella lactea]|uniref:DUF2255 family protein n=1 Tax=Nakamurella lactea TaxID=459515 RepID=UPI00040D7A26|nr:DUF2255 family protein [Nakamurella lactea]
MTAWNPALARAVTSPDEVQIVTRRRDGSLRRPRIIWIVGDDDRVYVRSTNGPTAGWFRSALGTGTGQLIAGGVTHEIRFTSADEDDRERADALYRSKYGRYASIVEHLLEDGPRAATLTVEPA